MQKMHRRQIGKGNPEVLVPFPVEKPYVNNKPRTRSVQGLHLDILAGQSVAYPNYLVITNFLIVNENRG